MLQEIMNVDMPKTLEVLQNRIYLTYVTFFILLLAQLLYIMRLFTNTEDKQIKHLKNKNSDSSHSNNSELNPKITNSSSNEELLYQINTSPEFDEQAERELISKYASLNTSNIISIKSPSSKTVKFDDNENSSSNDLLIKQLQSNQEMLLARLATMEEKISEMNREILFMKKSNIIHTHHSARLREQQQHSHIHNHNHQEYSLMNEDDNMNSLEETPTRPRRHTLTLEINTPQTPSNGPNMYIWEKQRTATLNVSLNCSEHSARYSEHSNRASQNYSHNNKFKSTTDDNGELLPFTCKTPLSVRSSYCHSNEATPRW